MSDRDMFEKNIEQLIKSAGKQVQLGDERKAQILNKLTHSSIVTETKKEHKLTWRMIMKTRISKIAVAAVIVIGVLIGVNYFGVSIDGTSVVWAEVVKRVERSHDELMNELLLAVEKRDTEKIEFYADELSEFWQGLNCLATAGLHPESQDRRLFAILENAERKAYEHESDHIGVQIFLECSEQFSDWLGKIEDSAWINETIHVCKQMEEYAEEIRDVPRDKELGFSHIEHCLLSFIAYCEWFEQLPWDKPEQQMKPAMLLSGIQRDLEIARSELEYLEVKDVDRYVKRCIKQAEKNVLYLGKNTEQIKTKEQRDFCRQLTRKIRELSDLITYATIASGDIQQTNEFHYPDAVFRVLKAKFGNKDSFAEYYIERIDQSLDLCEQLLGELGSMR